MSRDPLELLGDLPDWPGTRPPKNRENSGTNYLTAVDRFNGAKPVVYRIGGVDRQLFTVGELAKALNRKAITIRSWEHKGWLPKATYRTPAPSGHQLPNTSPKGRRLYSMEQVEFLLNAAEQYKIDDPHHPDWEGFRNHIKNHWPKG
jgi:hypothetical protein